MLQQRTPEDFVLATSKTWSVRDFATAAFAAAGVRLAWRGSGEHEQGVDNAGDVRVAVHPRFFRPAEVDVLCGNAARAKEHLGWSAQTSVDELARLMVEADIRRLERE